MPNIKKNEAQEEAIRTINGSVLLISCPGSGKTTTMIRRIKHMIDVGVNPANIVMVTFTDAAADEMRSRFAGSYGECGALFCTIHSLCLKILVESTGAALRVMPQDEQYRIIRECMRRLRISNESSAKEILGNISAYKSSGPNAPYFEPTGMYLSEFEKIYEMYEQEKNDAGYIDFDDILDLCLEKLKTDSGLLSRCRDQYRYIMCDEFQDTNYVQKDILCLIAGKNGNICVVGDDDQSIYGFRGAAPGVMQDFKNDYPGLKEIHMDINYRSMPEIIQAARNLIENNKERFEKDIRPAREGKGSVIFQKCLDRDDELEFVATKISDMIQNGADPSKIAILTRTNLQLDEVAAVLEKYGISYTSNDAVKDIYEHQVFLDLMSYLRLANNTGSAEDFMRIINKPKRYIKESVFWSIKGFSEAEITRVCQENDVSGSGLIKAMELYEDIVALRGKTLKLQVDRIVNEIGYRDYLISYAKSMDMDDIFLTGKLKYFMENAGKYMTTEEWYSAAKRHIRQHKENLRNKSLDSVTISTMHRSKGLEWDTVFIMDCCKGFVPFKKAVTKSEIEEERRLFYVAVTRAKESVYVMYFGQKPGRGGRITLVAESAFIEEIKGNGAGSRLSKEAILQRREKLVHKTISDFEEGAPDSFQKGMTVRHKDYGKGVVITKTPVMVSIRFGSVTKFFPLK